MVHGAITPLAIAIPRETGVDVPVDSFVIAAGAVIFRATGAGVIVTVCVAVAVAPLLSVTVHVTVVVPTGKPAEGALFVMVYGAIPPLAIAIPRETGVDVPVDSFVIAAGAVIFRATGAGVIVTVCVAVAVASLLSVTLHGTVVGPTGDPAEGALFVKVY